MTTPNTLLQIARMTEDEARAYLEAQRWPNGARCPHCCSENVGRIVAQPGSKAPARPGLWKCYNPECGEQFTVTVGTVMESSHIPLAKWIAGFHLMCSSKKGMSSRQIERELGLSHKAAWFMSHRIRAAMEEEPVKRTCEKLFGNVEIDETYVGGKPRKGTGPHKRGRGTKKTPVVALVQRGGRARATVVQNVTREQLRSEAHQHVDRSARIITDELPAYRGIGNQFEGGHHAVKHGAGEYVRGDIHTNTAECFFSLVKRAHYGTHHHYSKKHLPRYMTEREFMWNGRHMTDGERRDAAIRGAEGKRLMYQEPKTC